MLVPTCSPIKLQNLQSCADEDSTDFTQAERHSVSFPHLTCNVLPSRDRRYSPHAHVLPEFVDTDKMFASPDEMLFLLIAKSIYRMRADDAEGMTNDDGGGE